ncbi:chloride channel protein [Thermodesulfovibrio sp. 3907-1M]|uniref:Chloride channel protein n=1 Tax=Thermodesulfovibrio autotrophicus TaxID=3118333 RepID=A0AAU8GYK7_9BACT
MKIREKFIFIDKLSFFGKNHVFISFLIGIFVGIFAILFIYAINFINSFVLERFVLYIQPKPYGEGGESETYKFIFQKPYLLPMVVAAGGFIGGLLTYFFSPESRGIGTDAAIKAYHEGQSLSIKTSIIKLITSAITIGTGGTSGREGPIALIGGSIGSWMGKIFNLAEKQKRIFLAVGLGAGIAAIFKAPLAGALISGEVFFKRDFDIEAMLLSFIASVTAYTVACLVFGFQPIFSTQIPPYINIKDLFFYVGLGIVCAIVIRVYIFLFFYIKSKFDAFSIPSYIKPAIGGVITGAIGAFIPVAIGNGYGWIQLIIDGKLLDMSFITMGIAGVILGVSFTLGSGGSGGIFGPSVMIGGLTGAVYCLLWNRFINLNLHLPSFIVVGMVSLFGAAAKAPLSTLILIAEMTGGYSLLLPAMLSVFTAYYLSGDKTIFPSQVNTKFDSPAYRDEYGIYVLQKLKVKEYMKPAITVNPETPATEAFHLMKENFIGGLPVLSEGKVVGIITKEDIKSAKNLVQKKVGDIMTKKVITVTEEDTLAHCLEIMTNRGIGRLPVVKRSGVVVGIIARVDIGKAIRENLKES